MGRVERSIEIKASPEKVWEMLALDRFPEWEEGYKKDLKRIEYTSEIRTPKDKNKVGASARLDLKGEGEMNLTITESLENEKITYHLVGGKAMEDLTLTFLLESEGEETKFTYGVEYRMPWGVLGKFLEKMLAKRMVGKGIDKALQNLKSILEK